MITDFLLNGFYWLLWVALTPIRALPVAELPQGLIDAISEVGGYVVPLEVVIPITTLIAVFGAFLAVELFIFIWKGANWVLRRIPTQS